MADSAKDSKVEDVLSSVRRLVSEEVPRQTRVPMPPGPGALVLTDADRVEERRAQMVDRTLEQRIAELEAAVDKGGEEFEPDGSEDPSINIPDRIVYTRPPSSEEEAQMRGTLRLSEIALIKTAPGDEVDSFEAEPGAEVDGATLASVPFRSVSKEREKTNASPQIPEAPMAEDVPVEPAKRANVAAFTSPEDVIERIDARTRQVSRPSPQYETMPLNPPREEVAESKSKEAKPVEAKPEVAKPKDDFDMALMAAVKASVADAVQSELAAEPVQPIAEPDEPETDPKPSESETTVSIAVDNAALRRLVAELIREELQGELGERITRNVRKLVRREIKRALASEGLL